MVPILGSWESNCYYSVVDEVFYFIPEGPMVIHMVPLGIHVISARSILTITLRRRASHGLWLDSSNEIDIPKAFCTTMTIVRVEG